MIYTKLPPEYQHTNKYSVVLFGGFAEKASRVRAQPCARAPRVPHVRDRTMRPHVRVRAGVRIMHAPAPPIARALYRPKFFKFAND